MSYACGPYESFSVYNRYNRRRNRGGDEEDNEEEEVKDSWDITDEELKNVLGESATWPPVQELGGGWSKYSDDIVKCGSAKKAKGGVTVEQVLKSVGGYFGKMVSPLLGCLLVLSWCWVVGYAMTGRSLRRV